MQTCIACEGTPSCAWVGRQDRAPMLSLLATLCADATGSMMSHGCPPRSISGSHGVPACCPGQCGQCGGRGCESRSGGRDRCCAVAIHANGTLCSVSSASPCIPGRMAPLLDGYNALDSRARRRQRPPVAAVKDRRSVLNSSALFSFVHISKAGGATFIKWAHGPTGRQLFSRLYPPAPSGNEQGFLHDQAARPHAQRLVFLRSPRAHLLSMYKECRYTEWGRNLLAHNRSRVPASGTHQQDFEKWIDYYVDPLAKPWLGCYEPWNYQARAMTSRRGTVHDLGQAEDYAPLFDAAMLSYRAADWVGLTDFYDESLCLLLTRLPGARAATLFSDACRCDRRGSLLDVAVERHGAVSSSNVRIDSGLAAKMDGLTAVDKALFAVSLRNFFSEIKEVETRVSRRIMCPDVLLKAEPSLAYIANMTYLYEIA